MDRSEILALLRTQRHGIHASVGATGAPQAAMVGFAVSDGFEIVFDTLRSTRKYENLKRDPRVAFVVSDEREGKAWTAQIEGVADEPTGDELARLQSIYFAKFPDGPSRLSWPGITYLRIRPTWVRLTDYRAGGGTTVLEL